MSVPIQDFNRIAEMLAQAAAQRGVYSPYNGIDGGEDTGQNRPFGYYERTDADFLGGYSGPAQLAVSLLKSIGAVPDTWNYMPQGMPLTYGMEAYQSRIIRSAGYAAERQKITGDRLVQLASAAAASRGEILDNKRNADRSLLDGDISCAEKRLRRSCVSASKMILFPAAAVLISSVSD